MGELTTTIGFVAGLATTAANLPQVWKTYRSKSGEGLSFRMLLTLAFGITPLDNLRDYDQIATAYRLQTVLYFY